MEVCASAVECEAKLRMRFEDDSIADLIMKALQPDNEPLPRNLELSVRRSDDAVIFEIRANRPIQSILATLDDIIASTILALRIIHALGRA